MIATIRLKWTSKHILIIKNRPQCCIPAHQCWCKNCIKIHFNCGKISLSLPSLAFWYHVGTRTIHHHHQGRNIPWEWSPRVNFMVSNRPQITSYTLTPWWGLPTYFRYDITSRYTSSGCEKKGILNERIHWRDYHPHHQWLNMGVTIQKRSITGDIYHILATTDLRTTNSGGPPIIL